jgi:hypothetical protein
VQAPTKGRIESARPKANEEENRAFIFIYGLTYATSCCQSFMGLVDMKDYSPGGRPTQ